MAKTTEQATITVTTTVASDPVFAVIEAHQEEFADANSNAINDEYFQVASKSPHGRRGPELPDEELVDRMTDADEAERRANAFTGGC